MAIIVLMAGQSEFILNTGGFAEIRSSFRLLPVTAAITAVTDAVPASEPFFTPGERFAAAPTVL